MANMKEAISKREEKKRLKKEATCNQFFDLTKKAIGIEESMTKKNPIETEAKLMAEEREIMFVGTSNMTDGGETACHHPTTRCVIAHDLHKLHVSFSMKLVCFCIKFMSSCLYLIFVVHHANCYEIL
jgi:hypothetical protein